MPLSLHSFQSLHIAITTETSTLTLWGTPEESVGCVLRGCVVLRVKQPTRLKGLTLRLTAKAKIHCIERPSLYAYPRHYKKHVSILSHEWLFLTSNPNGVEQFLPGTYRYPFEWAIPGNAPESVNDHLDGSLSYKLKAVAQRPHFHSNTTVYHPLTVVRYAVDTPLVACMGSRWEDTMEYNVSIVHPHVCRGDTMFVLFVLRPLQLGLKVRHLTWFLKEYTSFRVHGRTVHAESRVIRFNRDHQFPCLGRLWEKTQTVPIPRSSHAVRCDTVSDVFKIEHKLKYVVSLVDQQGRMMELRSSIAIVIVDEKQEGLPTYEHALGTMLYRPERQTGRGMMGDFSEEECVEPPLYA
ncbi:hypothetical protein BDF14DRAFT_1751608 [Spinellus fusiger]|nr:hypothetical protein BDF14DRAFT_1751608 [Spinellus fusiger]